MPEKVTTTDDLLQVYENRDLGSRVTAQLAKGIEIQLGATTIHESREWIEATFEDGNVGYVLGPGARGHTSFDGTHDLTRPSRLAATSSEGPCPNCKLINPAGIRRCECSYDFLSGRVEDPAAWKAKASAVMGKRLNILLVVIAIIASFLLGLAIVLRGIVFH